jgi:hypothetical protein
VYSPDWVIVPVPCVTAHVIAVLLEPETVAANCCCHFSGIETVVGEMPTVMACGRDTVTIAEADFVVSATLTAVTV